MPFQQFCDIHTNELGPSFNLRYCSREHMQRLVYYEHIDLKAAAMVARLEDAGPILVEGVINILYERLAIHKSSSTSASSTLAYI